MTSCRLASQRHPSEMPSSSSLRQLGAPQAKHVGTRQALRAARAKTDTTNQQTNQTSNKQTKQTCPETQHLPGTAPATAFLHLPRSIRPVSAALCFLRVLCVCVGLDCVVLLLNLQVPAAVHDRARNKISVCMFSRSSLLFAQDPCVSSRRYDTRCPADASAETCTPNQATL